MVRLTQRRLSIPYRPDFVPFDLAFDTSYLMCNADVMWTRAAASRPT
jgi:hypothetical protein